MGYNSVYFQIRCLTNLHAGSGKNDYGAIDNLIQRDAATAFPCVYDSSLKGALREYFEKSVDDLPESNKQKLIDEIFGKESKEDNQSEQGRYIFLQAQLLSIPIRSNNRPYLMVTCPLIFLELADRLSFFGSEHTNLIDTLCQMASSASELFQRLKTDLGENYQAVFTGDHSNDCLEEEDIVVSKKITIPTEDALIKQLFGGSDDFVIVSDSLFSMLTDNFHLPVIARNKLDNGMSKALWYEQFLPRESRLMCQMLIPDYLIENSSQFFIGGIDNKRIQVGANATVGYGQCLFNSIL